MARTRSFDEGDVLCGAMHAFRRDGYAGVSIRQLEKATGLTSGSLYNAYGDKDGLYRAALTHYVDSFVSDRIKAHAGDQATLDDLQEYFLSLLREPLADGYGCLVTNAAVEFGSVGSIASEAVGRGLGLLASGVRAVLSREIGPDRAKLAADHLLLIAQGILVLARAGYTDTNIEAVVRAEFDRLRETRALPGQGGSGKQQDDQEGTI
jgi:TetR/AcrR family transcriptional repressor of nem operon